MHLRAASLSAVEEERAAARALAADMAKVKKKLEAEKKKGAPWRRKKGNPSLPSTSDWRWSSKTPTAKAMGDEGGDDGRFTPEEAKPEKGDEQMRPWLLGLVGKKGEKCTLEMMELGMELMRQGMAHGSPQSQVGAYNIYEEGASRFNRGLQDAGPHDVRKAPGPWH
jgi:hypothetical protein